MIVECSNCHAKYNIDESKLPPTGVKVKCRNCQQIMVIKKEEPVSQPIVPEVPAPPEEPEIAPPTPEARAPVVQAPSEQEVPSQKTPEPEIQPPGPPEEQPSPEVEGPSAPSAPAAEKMPEQPVPPEPPAQEAPPEPEIPEPEEAPVEQAPPESKLEIEPRQEALQVGKPPTEMSDEDKRWNERARRLAKALASDLVLYNQNKVEEGLREGTLAQLLGSEIRRSWEYYCQQIPKHIVESSDYFKEQLNKIVGKGKEIFK